MTLNETWKQCIAMWKWIAEQKGVNTVLLKIRWLGEHGFEGIECGCFFCDYADGQAGVDCEKCPAVMIDPNFSCDKPKYHYRKKRIAFYEKLVALNEKRLQ